jgi:hypothetical protein
MVEAYTGSSRTTAHSVSPSGEDGDIATSADLTTGYVFGCGELLKADLER